MALSTKLNEIVDMTRDEAKLSSNTSRGVDHRASIVRKIKRVYETLAEDFDWEHLKLKRDDANSRVQLINTSVIYTFPTSVNPQKISRAWVKWGGRWESMSYGISLGDWASYDPEQNQKVDPAKKWDFYSLTQFSVWPKPATDGVVGGNNEIAFEGQKKINPIVNEDSTLDLDDQLISLLVAAELLAGNGQARAADVAGNAAQKRLDRLHGNLGSKARTTMGMGYVAPARSLPRHPTYIRG